MTDDYAREALRTNLDLTEKALLVVLDLLWNKRGEPWCPGCQEPVAARTPEARRPHAPGCTIEAALKATDNEMEVT